MQARRASVYNLADLRVDQTLTRRGMRNASCAAWTNPTQEDGLVYPLLSDLEIAQAAKMRPIMYVAADAGILEDEQDLYGRYKAKVDL